MNEHMLMVIDHQINPGKYTQKQLRQNSSDAFFASTAATDATVSTCANIAHHAASTVTMADGNGVVVYAAVFDYWVDNYVRKSGENKQDYIDEINRRNKQ